MCPNYGGASSLQRFILITEACPYYRGVSLLRGGTVGDIVSVLISECPEVSYLIFSYSTIIIINNHLLLVFQ